uniref:Ig-like domain-containing protein n=1 Tax=Naja naja TaxID=35670 RepID=A0A8C6VR82_NAJNA
RSGEQVCCFAVAVSNQAIVTQEHQFLSIKEGDSISLKCSYSETASNLQGYHMHWYRQYPGEAPEFLLTVASVELKKHEHFSASFEKQKESRLNITKVQMKDAVVYFCMAQDPQQHRDTCCLYKNP